MFNKKVILGVFIFFIIVSLGFIKINTINTRALSPVGNTEDNYELVKEEFGEEFQEFIKDDAEVKIYTSKDDENNPSVKIGNKEFIIDLNNRVTKQMYNIGGFIYNGFNNIINKFDKKSDNNNETINSSEDNASEESNIKDSDGDNSNSSNKAVDSIIDNYLDSINNNEENSANENDEDSNSTNEDTNSTTKDESNNKENNRSNNDINSTNNENTELDNIINNYLESIEN
ncbi:MULTISPECIES: hypothetical protein [Clostridium]|uniref:hypothetical protein n=1 Tax=Clostridium TaxID=1485 RepID=UPI001A9B15C2|nr:MULTISPECIES: hypothetical protein [Clostridium]MBS5937186.1 hypothetical protein [Clostridium sp.]